MIKMSHCDECKHHRSVLGNELACALDHKPRWFSPKNDNPHDQNYGWKRRCEDFREMRPNARSEARPACGPSRSTEELGSD